MIKTESRVGDSPRVYVGSYKQYNEGSLYGRWFDLCDYEDQAEYNLALRECHKKEIYLYNDIEFMAQDWENLPDCCVCDGWVWSGVWEVLEEIDADKLEGFWSWFADCGHGHALSDETDAQDMISEFNERFRGIFDSFSDVLDWVEEREAENYHCATGQNVYESGFSSIFNCVDWGDVWESLYRHDHSHDEKTGVLYYNG